VAPAQGKNREFQDSADIKRLIQKDVASLNWKEIRTYADLFDEMPPSRWYTLLYESNSRFSDPQRKSEIVSATLHIN
jgi:hypothetical protein